MNNANGFDGRATQLMASDDSSMFDLRGSTLEQRQERIESLDGGNFVDETQI